MKKTEKQAWLHGGIGLLVGLLIGGVFTTAIAHHEHRSLQQTVEAHSDISGTDTSHDELSMTQMTAHLQGKTGDEFDKAFLEMMIPHHQGAVEMAELARTHAKHDEIKTLANAIMTSQLKEISDMYAWQKAWGYTSSYNDTHHH